MSGQTSPQCWEVVIERYKKGKEVWRETERVTLPYRGCTEAQARKKANLRQGTRRVVEVRPVPYEEFVAAYGTPGRKYG